MEQSHYLHVAPIDGRSKIVTPDGNPISLRGFGIGGYLHMENFINGYPGAENTLRAEFNKQLGKKQAKKFWNEYRGNFFNEEDITFIKSTGANTIRLPLNYRQFEDDNKPFQYKEGGFKQVDKVLGWAEKHGMYVILDTHAVPGGQNPDWHSDNHVGHALFWQHPHFQDRDIALGEEFARRYKDNPTVAGYDILNEPATGEHDKPNNWKALNRHYRRKVEAMRKITNQIIFLEFDSFASRAAGFDAPFADNLVYSSHNYSAAQFGPGKYPGNLGYSNIDSYRDKTAYIRIFNEQQGTIFTKAHNVPLWAGEFGAVYNGDPAEKPDRIRAVKDQIEIFNETDTHWTIWTYKDVGVMGAVMLDPQSVYMRAIEPILQKKRELFTDGWMNWLPRTEVQQKIDTVAQKINDTLQNPDLDPKKIRERIEHRVLAGYAAEKLQPEFVKIFADMSENDRARALESWQLKNCKPNQELIEVIKNNT